MARMGKQEVFSGTGKGRRPASGAVRRATGIEAALRFGVYAAIVFSALAFGAVEAWSLGILEAIGVVLLGVWVVKWIVERRVEVSIPRLLLPVAALACFGFIQSVQITGADGFRRSLSVDAEATRSAVVSIGFLLLFAVLTANCFVDRIALRRFATTLTIYGFALGLFALIQGFTWNGRFYWFRPAPPFAFNSYGPFVNHNHFAGYMEMLAPFPAAMVLSGEIKGEQRLVYGFAAALTAMSLAASLSRGGLLSLAIEVVFLGWWARRRRSGARAVQAERGRGVVWLRNAGMTAAIFASVACGIVWIGPERILDKAALTVTEMKQGQNVYTSRQWLWRDTLALIGRNEIAGTGLGAFETAFPRYSHADGSLVALQSHNDYLQVLADCGVIGGGVAALFLFLVVREMRRVLNCKDPALAAVGAGCSAGLIGLLFHSLFDFNMQIPSNALLFLVLAVMLARAAMLAQRGGVRQPAKPLLELEPHGAVPLITGVLL